MSASDLGSEIRSVRYAISGLRRQIDSTARSQIPGDLEGPGKWLDLLIGLLDTAEARLAEILSAPQNNRIALLTEASQLTRSAYTYLKECQGVDAHELPYSVAFPLKRLLDDLRFTSDFFFRAELEANYEIRGFQDQIFQGVRRPSNSLVNAIGNIKWPLGRITVPSRAFSILPHFAIIGHEIGHALLDKIDWLNVADPVGDPYFVRRVISRLDSLNQKLGNKISYTKEFILEKSKEIYGRWFTEFASDAVGFYLMGPALFFALQEFLLITSDSLGVSFTHPANYHRTSFLHKRLIEGGDSGFAKLFEEATERELTVDFNNGTVESKTPTDRVFQLMVTRLNRPAPFVLAAIIVELNEVVASCGDSIYGAVKRFFVEQHPGLIYTAEKYKHDIEQHLGAMLYAIPPIEKPGSATLPPQPTEFASILNIGWIVLLCKLEKMKLGDDQMTNERRVEILHGLIVKGVELSEARRKWQTT